MSEANVDKKVKGARKVRTGYVVSDKMQKTIVVELEDRKPHPLYKKTMRTNSKVKVHDENETAGVGDLVRIEETRPLSKDKHFRLVEIIVKARSFSLEAGPSAPAQGETPARSPFLGSWRGLCAVILLRS